MNEKLIIIGGGPSIKELDFEKLKNQFTFGLNFVCYFFEPTALIWVDKQFYTTNRMQIDNKNSIKITKINYVNYISTLNIIKLKDSKSFHAEQGLQLGLYSSYLVGLFSLSLGIALKFKEIYLLGYDCGFINNQSHFHDIDHRGRKNEQPYIKLHKFNVYKNYKNIFNVSLQSKLEVFPKISYNKFYDKIKNEDINQNEAKLWLKEQIVPFQSK